MATNETQAHARFTAEQLWHMSNHGDFSRCDPALPDMLAQAAEDSEVLARLKAWFIALNGVDYEAIVRAEIRKEHP